MNYFSKELAPFEMLDKSNLKFAVQWLDRTSAEDKLNLTPSQRRKILGGLSKNDYDCLLNGHPEKVKKCDEVIERLSALVNISHSIDILVGPKNSGLFFRAKITNSLFNYKSIKDLLLESESTVIFYRIVYYLLDKAY